MGKSKIKKKATGASSGSGSVATIAQAPLVDLVRPSSSYRVSPLLITATLIGLFSIYCHFRIVSLGEDYKGFLISIDAVFNLLFSLMLVVACLSSGRAISRRLKLNFAGFAEEASFSIMLGVGAVGLLLFAVGVLGLFKPVALALLFAGLLVVTRRESKELYTELTRVRQTLATRHRTAALLFGLLVFILAIRALLPPHAIDEAIYHLAAPRDFAEAGKIYPLYDNFSGDMPLLAHMFYVVCLIAKADIAARVFSLWLAITTAIAIYAFGARYLNRKVAILSMFGFFGAGMVAEVSVTTRIDVTLAGMGFVALYAMINYLETDVRGWLLASALLSGFSVGIKYTAGVWVALIAIIFIYESLFRKRAAITTVVIGMILFGAVSLAAFSPWLVKNYIYFKSPVYPFLTGEVAEYGQQGTRFFNADDERRMEVYLEQSRREIPQTYQLIEDSLKKAEGNRAERHPFRFWEFFIDPDRYNMGSAEGHHEPNYLFLLTPLLLFLPKRRWIIWLALVSVAFFCFVAATSWISRYYLPLYPTLTLVSVYVLVSLADAMKSRAPIAAILPVTAVATAVVLTGFVFILQFYVSGGTAYLGGRLSRRDFLQAAFYYAPIDYINHNSPKDSKVMLVGAQMGYHLQRDYLAEVGWDSVEWQRLMIRNDSIEKIHEDLQKQGVNYFLYGPGLFRFIAAVGRQGSGPSGAMYRGNAPQKTGKDYYVQLRNWATFELYRSKYLETVNSFLIEDAEYIILKDRNSL